MLADTTTAAAMVQLGAHCDLEQNALDASAEPVLSLSKGSG